MPEYDNTNQIAVWKKGENDHPEGPDFRITADLEGREFKIALWKNKSDNPKAPALKGKFEFGETAGVGAGFQPESTDFDF